MISKLYKDITTGALRRKRGAVDDLDLYDEEDAAARRREAKRREFARMRRELLKDEAVSKIAENKKKEAFLKSMEERDEADEDIGDSNDLEMTSDSASQSQQVRNANHVDRVSAMRAMPSQRPLGLSAANVINRPPPPQDVAEKLEASARKPSTVVELRKQISFLLEEPDSQKSAPDLVDPDEENCTPDAYFDLDRHLRPAVEDEHQEAETGLADFVVASIGDDGEKSKAPFKKPQLPTWTRPPASERRTKSNVVNRLALLRQASSCSSSSVTNIPGSGTSGVGNDGSTKALTFPAPASLARKNSISSTVGPSAGSSSSPTFRLPNSLLLRRSSTANSNFSTNSTTNATERGAVGQEKESIRKAHGGKRSTVNFYARCQEQVGERSIGREKGFTVSQLTSGGARRLGRNAARGSVGNKKAGFLGGLFRDDSWG